jgi:molybdate transport system ATP-binding protein
VRESRLLLLDEPFASLDRPLRRRILPYLCACATSSTCRWWSCRTIRPRSPRCARTWRSSIRAASVERGSPESVFASERGWRATSGEFENVLRGSVRELRGDSALLDVDGTALEVPASNLAVGTRALVAVRADEILIALERPRGLSARNVVAARVESLARGGRQRAPARQLAATPQRVWIELTAGAVRELDLQPGRDVYLVVKTRSFRVLSDAR